MNTLPTSPARQRIAESPSTLPFLGALAAMGALTMDIYMPAIPTMAAELGVAIVKVNNTISSFLIGYAIGQFFGGLLSDQVGRKRIGLTGLGIYVAACLLVVAAPNIEAITWLRAIQALGVGFSSVACLALVRDIYDPAVLGRRLATVTVIMLAAPLLAPAAGTLLMSIGWRSIFVAKAIYGTVMGLWWALAFPETHAGRWRNLNLLTIFRQCVAVLSRQVDGRRLPSRLVMALGFSASVMMVYLTNSAFLYMQTLGLGPKSFAMVFAFGVTGFIGGALIARRFLTLQSAARLMRHALACQLVVATLLLVLVIGGRAMVWNVLPCIFLLLAMQGIISPSGSAQYLQHFSKLAGSAAAVQMTAVYSAGGLFGWVSGLLYDGSLVPMTAVMLICSVMANAIARPALRQP
ncbi:MAG: MFS transporter [Steroidobacteraceae bacterium]